MNWRNAKHGAQRAAEARRKLADGVDPIAARADTKRLRELADARGISFQECADHYIAGHEQSSPAV